MSKVRPHLLLACGLLAYLLVTIHDLGHVPMIYEDEPVLASSGWKLANEGILGSDLFTGFYGMERHNYVFFPIHSILLAMIFKLFGVGLVQARSLTVLFGLIVIILTYSLGVRLFSPEVGLLAVFLMLVLRLTAVTPSQISGIVFLDMARIARYDMLVPAFGLSAFHFHLSARAAGKMRLYLVTGILAGLSALSHPNGIFWVISLVIILVLEHRSRWSLLGFFSGVLLPWVPYGLFILGNLPDWLGQTRLYAPRLELTNLNWYLNNLRAEPQRYFPGIRGDVAQLFLRPGFLFTLLLLPLSLLSMAIKSRTSEKASVLPILVPGLVIPAGLGLFVTLKLTHYLVTVIPVFALALAWVVHSICRGTLGWGRLAMVRPILTFLLLAVLVEGGSRILVLYDAGQTITSYSALASEIQTQVPVNARVLGLHHYWFGFEDYDYRTWAVPILLAYDGPPPAPEAVYGSLNQINPDYILLDPRIRTYLGNPQEAGPSVAVERWIGDHHVRVVLSITDPTYGLIEILKVDP